MRIEEIFYNYSAQYCSPTPLRPDAVVNREGTDQDGNEPAPGASYFPIADPDTISAETNYFRDQTGVDQADNSQQLIGFLETLDTLATVASVALLVTGGGAIVGLGLRLAARKLAMHYVKHAITRATYVRLGISAGAAAMAGAGCTSGDPQCQDGAPVLIPHQDPEGAIRVPEGTLSVSADIGLEAYKLCDDSTDHLEVKLNCGDGIRPDWETFNPDPETGYHKFTCTYDIEGLEGFVRKSLLIEARDAEKPYRRTEIRDRTVDIAIGESTFTTDFAFPATTNVGVAEEITLVVHADTPQTIERIGDVHPTIVIWESEPVIYTEDSPAPLQITREPFQVGEDQAVRFKLTHVFRTTGLLSITAHAEQNDEVLINERGEVQVFGELSPPILRIDIPVNYLDIWDTVTVNMPITQNPEDPVTAQLRTLQILDGVTGDPITVLDASTCASPDETCVETTIQVQEGVSFSFFSPPRLFGSDNISRTKLLRARVTANVDTENSEPQTINPFEQDVAFTIQRPAGPTILIPPLGEYPIQNPITVSITMNGHEMDPFESGDLPMWVEYNGAPVEVTWVVSSEEEMTETIHTFHTTSRVFNVSFKLPPDLLEGGSSPTGSLILHAAGTAATKYYEAAIIDPVTATFAARRPGIPNFSVTRSQDEYNIYDPILLTAHVDPVSPDTLDSASLTYSGNFGATPVIPTTTIAVTSPAADISLLPLTPEQSAILFTDGDRDIEDLPLSFSGAADTLYNDAAPLSAASATVRIRRPGKASAEIQVPDPFIDLATEAGEVQGILHENINDPIQTVTYHFALKDPATGVAIVSEDITYDRTVDPDVNAAYASWTPTLPADAQPVAGTNRAFNVEMTAEVTTLYRQTTVTAPASTIRYALPSETIHAPILNISVPYAAAEDQPFTYQIIDPEPDTSYHLTGPDGIDFTRTAADAITTPEGVTMIEIPLSISLVIPAATLLLEADNTEGGHSEFTHVMTITPATDLPAPIVNVTVNPAFCPVIPFDDRGENDTCTVVIDPSGSYAVDADFNRRSDLTNDGIASFTIDWGDGSPPETHAADGPFAHTYDVPGYFSVVLTVTDVNGIVSRRLITIQTTI